MATLAVGGTTVFDGATLQSGAVLTSATFPVGHILQVKSTFVTDRNSSTDISTSGTGADVGLNVTITPVSSTSDFFIQLSIGIWSSASSNSIGMILSKDGAKIGNGVDSSTRNGVWVRGVMEAGADGNHSIGASAHYLDTASGSAQRVYKCGLVSQTTNPALLNHASNNSDNALVYGSYTSSSLTVTEIQGA
jgi:hypothetical protein